MSDLVIRRQDVRDLLRVCRGRAAGLSARELVYVIADAMSADPDGVKDLTTAAVAAGERRLRNLVEELRMAGEPICAHPSTGYYYAETAEEIAEAIAFLRSRAMTSLQQIARLQRVALPELLGQMRLEAEHAP